MIDNLFAIYKDCETIPSACRYPEEILEHHGYPGVTREAAREAFIRHHVQQAVLGLVGSISDDLPVGQAYDLVCAGVAVDEVVKAVVEGRLPAWQLLPEQEERVAQALGADLLQLAVDPRYGNRWALQQAAPDHLAVCGCERVPRVDTTVREPWVKARSVRMHSRRRADS